MDIRNCNNCGKIYKYDGFSKCHDCRKEQEKNFEKVKEYLRENPGASINAVEEATGVPEEDIMLYLRQGRLEMDESSQITLNCEKCGAKIFSGRFCNKCTNELQSSFAKLTKESKVETKKPYRNNNINIMEVVKRNK